jgi:two-component system chemotaxis response regulator CheY
MSANNLSLLRYIVVDDMMVMRKIYKKSLSAIGVAADQISESADGADAWTSIDSSYRNQKPIQFVISDWNMPNMTGIDLLRKLRADERFKALPFLMVTAENSPENIKEALAAGVNNFIAKPFRPDELADRIKSIYQKAMAA